MVLASPNLKSQFQVNVNLIDCLDHDFSLDKRKAGGPLMLDNSLTILDSYSKIFSLNC
jgi:hypothetical protein